MMKRALFILLLPICLLAQEQGSGVELPEFVITGIEKVSLPAISKPKAEPVTMLSEEFIKPVYAPDELKMAQISNPYKKELLLFEQRDEYSGKLVLGLGINTFPLGRFNFGKNFGQFQLTSEIYGQNERAYVNNAGVNASGAMINADIFVSHDAGFFPGARFSFGGRYDRQSYRFYSSLLPELKRDAHDGNICFSALNNSNDSYKYGFAFSNNIFYLKDLDLTENLLEVRGNLEGEIAGFILKGSGKLLHQSLKNTISTQDKFNFIGLEGGLILNPSEDMKLEFGLNFANSDSNTFLAPRAEFAWKYDKWITLLGQFNPQVNFLALKDLHSQNRFIIPRGTENVFQHDRMNLNLAVKYEYETYFEISGGVKYRNTRNQVYFEDRTSPGIFDIFWGNVNALGGYLNMHFHPGPFGLFYGEVQLQLSKLENGNFVPYAPVLTSKLSYAYDFQFGLNLTSTLLLNSGSYKDAENSARIPGFIDAAVHAKFTLFDGFSVFSEVQNIFNGYNYRWYNYKEKPMDVIAGLEYRW